MNMQELGDDIAFIGNTVRKSMMKGTFHKVHNMQPQNYKL